MLIVDNLALRSSKHTAVCTGERVGQGAGAASYNAKVTTTMRLLQGRSGEANGLCLDDDRKMAAGLWQAGGLRVNCVGCSSDWRLL